MRKKSSKENSRSHIYFDNQVVPEDELEYRGGLHSTKQSKYEKLDAGLVQATLTI